MKIGSFNTEDKVLVVAEIGNNHEGDARRAAEIVRTAADCGVDAVKFQTVRAAQLVSRRETARFERLKSFELTDAQFAELSALARELGLLFLSTPLCLEVVNMLVPLVDAYKIASGDNDFFPLLEAVARARKPVIISTGASTLAQAQAAVACVRREWSANSHAGELAVLHCVSSYPTPPEQANLRAIPFLGERLGCTVGFSDHTLGIETCVLAVAAGARILEKHFTLDKQFSEFRDHALSADPHEMRELVRRVRTTEELHGCREKRVQPCEESAAAAIRRSIVAARALAKDATISAADIKWIRPGDGLRPGQEHLLVGKKLRRDVAADEPLNEGDVE
jgi:sialic acid synthase SpsE